MELADAQRAQISPQMSAGAAQLDPFEQREYLLKKPEVIMEALQILQQRQRAAGRENLQRTIAERSEEILNDPAAPLGGKPAGDVTLMEFFDYKCPYCRRVALTVTELEEADPHLHLVYKAGSCAVPRPLISDQRLGRPPLKERWRAWLD